MEHGIEAWQAIAIFLIACAALFADGLWKTPKRK